MGARIREARLARKWSVERLASAAGVSRWLVYLLERGEPVSVEAVARLADALGLRLEAGLVDPRKRERWPLNLAADPVHSAMGEFEAAQLRSLGFRVGIDEPYQHFQFAGRADVVAWDVASRALLHLENRTRFPDLQQTAGSYNAKRSYLAAELGERLGVNAWASETHVIVALWSSEVLHSLRLRTESFRALCPDDGSAFESWWRGDTPRAGKTSALVVLDPLAKGRRRAFVGLDAALPARPRYRGYADAASAMMATRER